MDDNNWQIIRELIQDTAPAKAVQHAVDVLQKKKENLFTDKNNAGQADQGTTQEQANTYVALTKLVDPEAIGYTRHDYLFAFALHTYFSIQFHKVVLEEQMESLRNELRLLEEQMESLRNELRLSEEQREAFHDELRLLGETCFSFDYSRLQALLSPQVFDTEFIQEELRKNLDKRAPQVSFSLNPPQQILFNENEVKSFFVRETVAGRKGDLLHCFYQALSIKDKPIVDDFLNTQRGILRLQDYATFVCCNWDVQEQIVKSMIGDEENSAKFGQVMSGYEEPGTLEHINAFFQYIVGYIAKKETTLNMRSKLQEISGNEELTKLPIREYFIDEDPLFNAEPVEEEVRRASKNLADAKKFIETVKKAPAYGNTPASWFETRLKDAMDTAESDNIHRAEDYYQRAKSAYEVGELDKAHSAALNSSSLSKETVSHILDIIAHITEKAEDDAENDAEPIMHQIQKAKEEAAEVSTPELQSAMKVAEEAANIVVSAATEAQYASTNAEEAFNADNIDKAIECACEALAKADEVRKALEDTDRKADAKQKADEATRAVKDARRKAAPRKRGSGRKPKDAPTSKNPDEANDGNSGGDAP